MLNLRNCHKPSNVSSNDFDVHLKKKNMNKKAKKWLLILSIILVSTFLFYKINQRIKIIELTSINVETENEIDVEKVKI